MKLSLRQKIAATAGLVGALALGIAVPTLANGTGQSAQDAARADAKATAALATPDCRFFSATNTATQNRVYTNNTPGSYFNSAAWADLTCGSFSVTVPRGKSALAVVKTDAEVTCTTANANDFQWCQGRVLFNGAEGQPNAPEGDSFAWANSQTDPNAWESNAFTRTAYLRCPSTSPTSVCTFPVKVQVKNHAAGLNFRVDDSTVDARLTYF
jgi:hypothetical protein